MFNLSVSWWELIVRCIVVYLFMLVLLRITGKRRLLSADARIFRA